MYGTTIPANNAAIKISGLFGLKGISAACGLSISLAPAIFEAFVTATSSFF